jgi:hypothetical protein
MQKLEKRGRSSDAGLLAAGKLQARRLGHRTMIEAQSLHSLVNSLPRVTTPTMQRRAPSGTERKPAV